MYLKHSAKSFAIISVLLVAGCSGTGSMFPPSGDAPFKIESDPSGAAVYVMGENIGVTPLKISQKDVFPTVYPGKKQSLYGKVTIKKTGCADFTKTVNGNIIVNGLRAKLDCGNNNPAPSATSGVTPQTSETVEQRLDKIKELLNKGLISEDEAKQARARILNEL
ncbi:MAG TPA: PEGA domain-containing protein [Gallionella sp.]|nr:PEGA domain-containing protein [Gallionella sp.]